MLSTLSAAAMALHQPVLPPQMQHAPVRSAIPQMALASKLKLEIDPEEAAKLLEDGPAASQGPFGKGGALEWVALVLDKAAEDTLSLLHAFDDKAVQDSSKNLQVLWSRAVLARMGDLDDPVAYNLLPESTRGVIDMGIFDGVAPFLEWVAARTAFLNEGCDAFLSSPSCANGAECQVVVFGAGFDTRSIRYQREGLRFFEVDLPGTIEAKRVVHERYAEQNPGVRLPTRVGFDLNDCEQTSLLDLLEREHGLKRDVPTLFISEAVMFYVNPRAIASLYADIFAYGEKAEAMYCFTDSMRPLVSGPFSDEITRFFDQQDISVLSHQARWSGAVQFVHAVARTPETSEQPTSLLNHVKPIVEAPVNSYAPERAKRDVSATPSFNNAWYAIAFETELADGESYATRLFGEPITLKATQAALDEIGSDVAPPRDVTATNLDGSSYRAVAYQGVVWIWRGANDAADLAMLPTHPTPEATHAVETILDYGCDWSYIVENNLDTPHLYWLHDGSIPPIQSLGCNRDNIGSIGLRFFQDDCGVGHIGKTSKKVTKVVRYDAPNVVRHGGVSGFSEEFNIIPVGPHRTRVLLRQRFPKGPILSTLLKIPGTRATLQFLVRNWNYQIGLEDYCVMQGQAHNIDDLGSPNWKALGAGDDLIVKFWKWKRAALDADGIGSEYYTRWDGSTIDPATLQGVAAEAPARAPTHGGGTPAMADELRPHYVQAMPAADYPPINYRPYPLVQEIIDRHIEAFDLKKETEQLMAEIPKVKVPSALGGLAGLAAGAGVIQLSDWVAVATQATVL